MIRVKHVYLLIGNVMEMKNAKMGLMKTNKNVVSMYQGVSTVMPLFFSFSFLFLLFFLLTSCHLTGLTLCIGYIGSVHTALIMQLTQLIG